MLTIEHLEGQRKKLLASQEAYQKNLASAQSAALKFQDELKRHEGALWEIDQLIALLSEQPAPQEAPPK